MSSDRDTTRIVRSWLDEGVTALPDRVLDLVLDQLPSTPQRRTMWLARRFPVMNSNIVRFGVAAAAVVLAVIVGINLLPGSNFGGPSATATPVPSPAPLAVGSFVSHGGQIQLDATGDGPNVTGTMTYTDVGGADLGGFVVDLACTRTTDGGLMLIGGPIIDATKAYVESAPEGSNIALVLQRGSPVKAEIFVEYPGPHEPSCPAFLESIPDLGDPERDPSALEPIEGTIELR
jgi:hypothetical protein